MKTSLKTALILVPVLLALALNPAGVAFAQAAGILFAAPLASGSGDCSSWPNACTLQTALTNASSGDEIWVAAGTHTPHVSDRAASFELKNGVAIYGGFTGTETARDQRDPVANLTILSGDIDNNDSQTPIITDLTTVTGNTTNSYHVVMVTGASDVTLDGFTITAGYANGSSISFEQHGGGMFNEVSSPALTNIIFSGNSADFGGGMFNAYGSPTLTNVTFSRNYAEAYGGGMYNAYDSNPTFINATFGRNSAAMGGGLYNDDSNPTLTNATFSGNSASYGGGIYNNSSNSILTNVTFGGNSALASSSADGAGAIYNNNSNPQIRNAIFWGNTAPNQGAQIYNKNSSPIVSDSVIQDGCSRYSICTNIIRVDPRLGALNNHGGFTSTIPLLPGSSAINTGNDTVCPSTDQRGLARPQGDHCDIGAFEFEIDYTGVYYAKPVASGTGDCHSWDNACTLQTALTTAIHGDEIWAAAGKHTPTIGTDRAATFQLKGGVAVYGGFAGTETAREQRNFVANQTVLSGDIDNNDSQTPVITDLSTVTGNTTNSDSVVSGATDATLDGFTITAGKTSGNVCPGTNCGAGMINYYSSPNLANLTFSGNSASYGGGMANYSSSPTLTNVTFSGNSASSQGGGVWNKSNSSPVLVNVTFSRNSALYGGGICNWDNNSPTLTNVTFSRNSASHGGGMFNYSSSPTLTNVTLSGNSANAGGGIYNHTGNNLILTNVTFSGNSANNGGGMYNYSTSSGPTIRNTIFWGNTASTSGAQIYYGTTHPIISDSIVQGGYVGGTNIITTDPVLGTFGTYDDSFTETFPLLAGSSAIDAGNDAFCPVSDQRGLARPQGAHCDIGAFEYVETTAPETQIDTSPVNPNNSTEASFTFSSPDVTATFECSLDGTAFTPCINPKDYSGLAEGAHTFRVRARDSLGKVDATAAFYAWLVDLTAPETQIDTSPANPTTSTEANFTFSSSDGTATFECSLDGEVFAACTSPKEYTGLADGSHTFAVRAKDSVGNPDTTPAVFIWTIGTTHTPMVLYAKLGAIGASNCSGWANACTLQTALASASNGDEIWVAAGRYTPTTSFDRAATFLLKDGVAVYGGFAGAETARDQRDSATNLTILSGDIDNNDSQTPIITDLSAVTGNTTNSYHVVTGANGAILDGFTITAGHTSSDVSNRYGGGMYNVGSSPTLMNMTFSGNSATSRGGGIYNDADSNPILVNIIFSNNSVIGSGGGMYNVGSSPTLTNVTFSGNSATSYGGGIYNTNSSPALMDIIFSGNSASIGAGMYNWYSNPVLTNVTFGSNSASESSGGMYNYTSSPTLADGIFSGNSANYGGGMVNTYSSSPTLTNVTFSDNAADTNGGGMFNHYHSSPVLKNVTFSGNLASVGAGIYNFSFCSPVLTNVTFSDNTASTFGGGMYNLDDSNPSITNTIFWGNTAATGAQIYNDNNNQGQFYDSNPIIRFSVVEGGYIGSTIITTDPILGTLDNYGGFTQTIPLLAGSSAIDTGTNTGCPAEDQRGVARPQGARCDIGAYEYVDLTAPDTQIDSKPADPNNSAIATFTFSSDDVTASFECSLDGNAFATCFSPRTYTGLVAGSHTFAVRAKDPSGNRDATPASYTWTIDLTRPDTQIDSKPANPSNSAEATFTFSSEDATASFECSLDGGPFTACASPKSYTGLAVGSHSFTVRAKDPAGNTDATPASYTWTIDLTAPDTQIDSKPADPSNSAEATFTFSSEDATASFECSLDGGPFTACASPKSYTGLAVGSHTFTVRAKDPAGNTDATPASYTWTIDLTAPTVVSSLRTLSSPTSVDFAVTFSESVSGVDVTDFGLTSTGTISDAAVTGISGAGITYTVTASTGTGAGTLRLDVPATATIEDLAGNPLSGLPYTSGEAYTIELPIFGKTAPTDSATGQPLSPTLSWSTSDGATSYEYCYSSAPGPCTKWNPVGASTSVTLSGLAPNYTYYWQARAVNPGGVIEADDGTWWSFTMTDTPPVAWPPYAPPATATFNDVPMTASYWDWVERLVNSAITAGCGSGNYCPNQNVTRAQMAIFLLRAKYGSDYTPPPVGESSGFDDVPVSASYAPWVKQLAAEGITGGCGGGNFCPFQAVNRAQMAIFLLRARHGSTYSPPAVGATTGFGDVPLDATYAPWVKQLAAESITGGCGGGNFCPFQSVNRAQMATFIVRAFGLP